ncbi:hypothetical protein [Saccharibacillus kuerlensis]|uniref:ZIP Zinc transporter n=1 Tax=Saccharibacillus kuerlensis TaxID=459527 RepID=A0ABQ2L3B8_9BACL|nr:hypothetical protein [Saccharibacillus kuerlensis]GGN99275.1 hypothetical protein GCM10010969_19210 [Saccharibacillus kuerlensis]
MNGLIFLIAVLMALVHMFSASMKFLDTVPRSRFLSLAGGVAVAYVFVHILPELKEHQESFESSEHLDILSFMEHHAYLIAMLGLVVFYALERTVKISRQQSQERHGEARPSYGIYRVHMISFALYNALIGYLLVHRIQETAWNLILFSLAMALHFVVNDHSLREDHQERYDRRGRWILTASILIGWGIGMLTEVPELVLASLFAFLSGGILLNVLKEELPEEKQSSLGMFLLGTIGYSMMLLAF